jgi:CubicO group peptidase (beta-lactamase class C family)
MPNDTASPLMSAFPPPAEGQVKLENFQNPPFNRWGFCNIRRILPTANVWRGDGPAATFETVPQDLDGVAFEDREGRAMTVAGMLGEGYTDGFLVLHQGRIVMERYFNGFQPNQQHLLMSVTKSFAGSLTGILVERGDLDVGGLVTDVLPELAGSAYDGATLRHVLDMTVGTDFNEDYDDPACDSAMLDAACGWRLQPDPTAPDNMHDYLKTVRPSGAHGEVFHYVSAHTDVLGWMLERVSGMHFSELLSREIWQPMGAEFDAYIATDRLGASQTDGGLCVTLRDLARFGQLHLHDGIANGHRIVPFEWIIDQRENGDRKAWARGDFVKYFPDARYRAKWYQKGDAHDAAFGIGIHGQTVYVDRVAGMVIAKFSTHPQAVDDKLFDDMFRGFAAIGHHLADDG